jgi:hypothetical protein
LFVAFRVLKQNQPEQKNMGDRGVFAVHRGLFGHPFFKREPLTEREAWTWMIGEAAWKATRVRINRATFSVERGQLVHAMRYLASRWQWSEPRVRRFLARLKREGMIDTLAHADATLITICKYDDYQFGTCRPDAPGDEPATHSRRREEEPENLDVGVDARAPARDPMPSPEAFGLAAAYRKAVGVDPDDPQWVGLPYTAQVWVTRGYDGAAVLAFGSALAARYGPKPMSYHAKAIENEMNSVKKAGASNAQNRHGSHTRGGTNGTGGGFASAAIFHARAASET